ncbi:C3HC zinc finger-like-domain-containing protein [Gamsiella multidivaricata]|uniref:C3HC zinc finger-like-domain-containing protein n=1 Tax=Gamsiella multidivaricata TaxID=101098 RepID=UPI00221F232A|nr:C3HC zinc finger-like-domain-containing protein [Gamsiella multidivaricata]KAI7821036.1 C3HC zinc finger-like-domain-containing protein [Gamsiella multidivaricata]
MDSDRHQLDPTAGPQGSPDTPTSHNKMESKRKIEESLTLLNSLFAHPSKKRAGGNQALSGSSSKSAGLPSLSSTRIVPKKRVYLPPRPAVLDKLSRLAASRPTLKDSIAASIAASAPTTHHTAPASPGTQPDVTTSLSSAKANASVRPSKARYLPWSREQFHERLETFKPSTWFDKPKVVNAVECAKRGWINTSDDKLECCGGCGGVVIVRIDQGAPTTPQRQQDAIGEDNGRQSSNVVEDDLGMDDTTSESDIEALGPKFHAMLTDNHKDSCLWKAHPCDDSIYKFPVLSQSQAQEDLLERVRLLEAMYNDPLIRTIRHPLSKDEADKLRILFPSTVDVKLLILSLFGWSALEQQKVLACKACHTQCAFIPSHAFSSVDAPVGDGSDGNGAVDEFDDTAFDVAESHKWYCYWVDPHYDTTRKAGWRILFERLISALNTKIRGQDDPTSQQASAGSHIKPNDALAQIRRMLRGQATIPPTTSSPSSTYPH